MGIVENRLKNLLSSADVEINGSRSWDIQVHNEKFFCRVLKGGTVGLGESYIDGWWDCEALDQLIYRLFKFGVMDGIEFTLLDKVSRIKSFLINQYSKTRSKRDIGYHYDLRNDLFEVMLDKHMNYSCGYWKDATTLDEAQEAKMELICKKLKLESGMTVLEIGCGWGGFAKYVADKYKVKVTGVTISESQHEYAKKYCEGSNVEIRLQDYRNISGKYDRIVSIEMIEHVGHKNLRKFMEVAYNSLKKDGIFLIQFDGKSETVFRNDPWIEKYLFPNTLTPSAKQISTAIDRLFYIADWHDFTEDYHKTMMEWYKNFHYGWPKLKKNYDEKFYRMWRFYLLCCPGTALAKTQHLWQTVLIRTDSDKKYERACE